MVWSLVNLANGGIYLTHGSPPLVWISESGKYICRLRSAVGLIDVLTAGLSTCPYSGILPHIAEITPIIATAMKCLPPISDETLKYLYLLCAAKYPKCIIHHLLLLLLPLGQELKIWLKLHSNGTVGFFSSGSILLLFCF